MSIKISDINKTVWYHGGDSGYTHLRAGDGIDGRGVYLTADLPRAKMYSHRDTNGNDRERPCVYTVRVHIDPARIFDTEQRADIREYIAEDTPWVAELLAQYGERAMCMNLATLKIYAGWDNDDLIDLGYHAILHYEDLVLLDPDLVVTLAPLEGGVPVQANPLTGVADGKNSRFQEKLFDLLWGIRCQIDNEYLFDVEMARTKSVYASVRGETVRFSDHTKFRQHTGIRENLEALDDLLELFEKHLPEFAPTLAEFDAEYRHHLHRVKESAAKASLTRSQKREATLRDIEAELQKMPPEFYRKDGGLLISRRRKIGQHLRRVLGSRATLELLDEVLSTRY